MDSVGENDGLLFEKLESLGFTGETLQSQIRNQMNLGIPNFYVDHTIHYEQEGMIRFRLHLQKDQNKQKYSLLRYTAQYLPPYPIKEEWINGINIADLDERMSQINWRENPSELIANARPNQFETSMLIPRILSDLWKLAEQGSEHGRIIQNQLRVKHWTDTVLDTMEMAEVRRKDEMSMALTILPQDLCNAHLCFQQLSGKWDALSDILVRFGFESRNMLRKALCENRDSFQLNCYKRMEEGIMHYELPFKKDTPTSYKIEEYVARLIPYPTIDHSEINGIHTIDLEEAMERIDWTDEYSHYINEDGEPMFTDEIAKIIEFLHYALPMNPKGKLIADQLQAKFWPGSPDFEGIMENSSNEYLESLPAIKQIMPTDINVLKSYNYNCGRAILLGDSVWMQMDKNKTQANGDFDGEMFDALSEHELKKILVMLPIDENDINGLMESLQSGNVPTIPLKDGNGNIVLQANPKQQCIDVFTLDGKKINTNVYMDPDWHPPMPEGYLLIKKQEIKAGERIKIHKVKGKKRKH